MSFHAKSFIGKDPGKDWGLEEKGTTEDEMVGWHHRLNEHGFGWTPGVGDGQGGLACWASWGRKESDMTERLNWTRFFIAFLLRSKCLLILLIQSPSTVILEDKKALFPLFLLLFAMKWWDQMPWFSFFFLMLSFKPAFPSFTLIKRLFSSFLLSVIREVSTVYHLRLTFLQQSQFLLVIHPDQHFTWCTLHTVK